MEQTTKIPDADLDQKIIRQVEYYFGDYNLPKDKFLQEQIKLDDGWIPLTTMLNFNRLAALTKDEDTILNALKKSSNKLLEVDEEKKKIRRSAEKPIPEMSESRQKEIQSRTAYCKGFTKENATLDKLLEYFSQFGAVDNVQMRTYLDKATKEYIFKGSVFVAFSAKVDAEKFMEKDSVEYDGVKLITKWQEDYLLGKKQEREEKKKVQKAKVLQATNRQGGQRTQNEGSKDSDEEIEEEEKSSGFPKGALIYMKNVPKTTTWEDIKSAVASVWREGAKDDEEKEITVAYVDYRMGDGEGWIRLGAADTALTLLQRAKIVAESNKISEKTELKKEEKNEDSGGKGDAKAEELNGVEKDKEPKKDDDTDVKEGDENAAAEEKSSEEADQNVSTLEVPDGSVCIRALQGSEEDEYLSKVREERDKKYEASHRNRRRGGHGGNRRGRGGRGGKRKHNWEGGPAHKRRH
ncbi:la protein homolog [Ischnura elegans]|uniref:la protein homolog n=1 Tax=Ischnura elegans TaxID=197161 RepID=UPI001ED86CB7|nr:la protein homolog [Ischnura elegans]